MWEVQAVILAKIWAAQEERHERAVLRARRLKKIKAAAVLITH